MRVLVVEEDEMLAEFLRGRLSEEGFDARVAASAPEAEALLEAEAFEVMVLDLSLPEESGLHALRQARARRPDLIILVLAPAGSPADCVKGLDAGADDYLAKPFSFVGADRAHPRAAAPPLGSRRGPVEGGGPGARPHRPHGAARTPSHRPDPEGIRAAGVPDGTALPAGRPRGDHRERPGNWKRTSPPTWWPSTSTTCARRWMRDSTVR